MMMLLETEEGKLWKYSYILILNVEDLDILKDTEKGYAPIVLEHWFSPKEM